MSMGTIARIDSTVEGGKRVVASWDTDDAASVAVASTVFEGEKERNGGVMVRCDPETDLTGTAVRTFDPLVGEYLSPGRYAGG